MNPNELVTLSFPNLLPTLPPIRGTAASLAASNPIPALLQLVIETDTGFWKRGTGQTYYNSLTYVNSCEDLFTASYLQQDGSSPLLVKVPQQPNLVYASPVSGVGVPTFRTLQITDLPNLPYGSGTVLFISIATANGFNGSSNNQPTSPQLTIGTTVTGLVKGSGGAISAAASSDVISALGYTPVPTTRTLTINSVTYDLSADRSWTVTGSPSSLAATLNVGATTNSIPITSNNGYAILTLNDSVSKLEYNNTTTIANSVNVNNAGNVVLTSTAAINHSAVSGHFFTGLSLSPSTVVGMNASNQLISLTLGNGLAFNATTNTLSSTLSPSVGGAYSYYLNGSVASGVVGYEQLSQTAVIGSPANFTLAGNGLVCSFLTDSGNPNALLIPAGNWTLVFYASMSSNGGSPEVYMEVCKYDGATFTVIATSTNEPIINGTAVDIYNCSVAMPATTLLATDRIAIRVYSANNSGGRTITFYTQDSHLAQLLTTFPQGIGSLNGLTANTQLFAVGTSGTDFNIVSATATHTFNLPTASAAVRGALSSADWTTFNNKISLTSLSSTATGLTYTNTTGVFSLTSGYVIPTTTEETNWNTAYANRITSLTVTGSSGSATLTGTVLNIPTYTLAGLGGQPLATNLTSLSGLSYSSLAFVKMSAAGTFSLDTTTYYSASNPSSYIALTALSSTATGLTYTNTTGVFSLTSGYVIPTTTEETNWNTAYANRITSLTVTGSSGAATLTGTVLNIPTYTLAGLGGTTLAAVNAQNLSVFAATTSAQLLGVISDETGSGLLVFNTSPTLVTPILGTPTSGTLTNCTGLPAAGGGSDAWVDYSSTSTVVGWSSTTTKSIRYKKIGTDAMIVSWYIVGTSNSTSTTFTIPVNCSIIKDMVCRIQNNGTYAAGIVEITTGSNVMNGYISVSGSSWTATGSKLFAGEMTVQY